MKRTFLTFLLVLVCGSVVAAQSSQTRAQGTAGSATSVSKSGRGAQIESGTQVAAQLQNTLDARKARVGDRVVLKTTEAIKANGHTVVGKGAHLIGHVTEVQQQSRANGASHIGLVFDRLEKGSLETPITATISSITQARARAQSSSDDLFSSDISSSSRSSASAGGRQSGGSAGGGGLLGGVGSTVGGTVNATTSTVGNVAGATTATVGAVGSTTRGLTRSVGGIQIMQSTDASAEGGALLTLQGGNLRLDQGASFRLVLSQSTSAGNNQ